MISPHCCDDIFFQFWEAFEKECHAHAKETNVVLTSDFSGRDLFKSFSQTLPVPEVMNAIAVLKNKGDFFVWLLLGWGEGILSFYESHKGG